MLHGEVSLAGLLAMADGMGGLSPWLCSREWRVRGWRLGTRFATWPKGGRRGHGRGRASRTALAGGAVVDLATVTMHGRKSRESYTGA